MQHLAMIMDGNRRWAKKKGFAMVYDQSEVKQAIRTAVEFCFKKGISFLSLFMLSLENVQQRSYEFLDSIFSLTIKTCQQEVKKLVEQGVRVRFVGDRSLYPANVLAAICEIEEQTKNCTTLTLCLLFYYGARQEVVNAAKKLAKKVHDGLITADAINEEMFHNELWTAGIPDPDLVIRTGAKGAARLSNFLLYQSAYCELQFLDIYWPELTTKLLEDCVKKYNEASRNVGR